LCAEENRQVIKIKNFFSTLRKLAAKEAGNVIVPVTELIQKLIVSSVPLMHILVLMQVLTTMS